MRAPAVICTGLRRPFFAVACISICDYRSRCILLHACCLPIIVLIFSRYSDVSDVYVNDDLLCECLRVHVSVCLCLGVFVCLF